MSIAKMFSALLVAACAAHMCATQVRAEPLTKPALSRNVGLSGCSRVRGYERYFHAHVHRPNPFSHPRTHTHYRKPNPNE